MFENISGKKLFVIIIIIILVLWLLSKVQFNATITPSVNENMTTSSPQLLYFTAANCGYCQQFDSIWTELVQRLQTLPVTIDAQKLDMSDPTTQSLATYYGVVGTPTIVLVTGNGATTYDGERNADRILDFIIAN